MFSSCKFISALKLLNVDSAQKRAHSLFISSNINTKQVSETVIMFIDLLSLYLLFDYANRDYRVIAILFI